MFRGGNRHGGGVLTESKRLVKRACRLAPLFEKERVRVAAVHVLCDLCRVWGKNVELVARRHGQRWIDPALKGAEGAERGEEGEEGEEGRTRRKGKGRLGRRTRKRTWERDGNHRRC